MCNLGLESHCALGAKFVHTAWELSKQADVSLQNTKKERGDGPALFKHGWISLSVFQGKWLCQVLLPSTSRERCQRQSFMSECQRSKPECMLSIHSIGELHLSPLPQLSGAKAEPHRIACLLHRKPKTGWQLLCASHFHCRHETKRKVQKQSFDVKVFVSHLITAQTGPVLSIGVSQKGGPEKRLQTSWWVGTHMCYLARVMMSNILSQWQKADTVEPHVLFKEPFG